MLDGIFLASVELYIIKKAYLFSILGMCCGTRNSHLLNVPGLTELRALVTKFDSCCIAVLSYLLPLGSVNSLMKLIMNNCKKCTYFFIIEIYILL